MKFFKVLYLSLTLCAYSVLLKPKEVKAGVFVPAMYGAIILVGLAANSVTDLCEETTFTVGEEEISSHKTCKRALHPGEYKYYVKDVNRPRHTQSFKTKKEADLYVVQSYWKKLEERETSNDKTGSNQ